MHADTLPALFRSQAERLGPRIAVRFKQNGLYRDLSWNDYRDKVDACAAALVLHGIERGDRVAILAENRVEWLITDMAILAVGGVTVPLHAPLTARQVHDQLDHAGARFVFVADGAQPAKINEVRPKLPHLLGVSFDPDRWQEFLERGRLASPSIHEECRRRAAGLTADDLATIIYTSGTTGNPKGVMLTQRNLLSNALAFAEVASVGQDSIVLNWLPFSHIYARTVDIYVPLAVGATLCLAESADTVIANLAEIQPTNMSAVPRFYEKVLAAVQHPDPKVLAQRLKAIFGPRIDFLGSGGAPLPISVARAYHDAGLLLLQGYGLTESSPVIAFNRKHSYKLASVGQPIPGIEVRIAEDGEILTRGPHVMAGYWKNAADTASAIPDGWLHTGDVGQLDAAGFLTITGRKKDLLVLSNGKKVAPARIEGILLADPCIDQVVVCGEGRNFLTALIVPHWANLAAALARPESELSLHEAQAFLGGRIAQALAGEAPWEQVRKIVVLREPFSVARDELTVSLKMRRNVIVERHAAALAGLYED